MGGFNLNEYHVTTEIPDVSETNASSWVAVPDGGELVMAKGALAAAVTGTSTVTVRVDGVDQGAFTVTGAAGDTGMAYMKAGVAESIEIVTDGGSTGAAPLGVTLTIRR